MLTNNPLLAHDALLRFDQIRPEHVLPAVTILLQEASDSLETVVAPGFPADWS
jgi:oligopeptidase A